MQVQVQNNNSNIPFIRDGIRYTEQATLAQDAGRSAVLAFGTVMAKVAATQKWVPFTSETATDGTSTPTGIFIGADVTAAALVAGDVLDAPILVGGACLVDNGQVVIENSKTLATVLTTGTTTVIQIITVKDALAQVGIFVSDTVDITSFENS